MPVESALTSSRRDLLLAAASLPLLAASGRAVAAGLSGDELPLHTTGLEHFGMTVPDVVPATRFYSAVFGPGLFKEKDPPLRYYVTIGKGYIALGSREGVKPVLDHYSVNVEDMDRDKMMAAIAAAGLPNAGRGMTWDPDHIGLQMLKDPAGLAPTTVGATERFLDAGHGYGLVQPVGMDHVLLKVVDLDRSAKFYDRFFARTPARDRGQIWFKAGDTTIRLAKQDAGKPPLFERFGVRVAAFDAGRVGAGLTALGAKVLPSVARGQLLFDDPNGLGVTLVTV